MCPHTGAEPGDKICNGAGEGRALTNAAVKGVDALPKRGCGDNGGVSEGFSNPLCEAKLWETKDGKWDELEFGGETIEVFFLIFINVSKEGVFR